MFIKKHEYRKIKGMPNVKKKFDSKTFHWLWHKITQEKQKKVIVGFFVKSKTYY